MLFRAAGLPEKAPAALGILASISAARDEDELRRILAAKLLALPPWAGAIVVDANGQWPSLESGDFRLNGDLTLGYNGGTFGVVGRGSALSYDLSSPLGLTQTDRYDGALEAWGFFAPSPALGFEFRLTGQAALYDTTVVDLAANLPLQDETSVMGRGTALLGLRSNPTARWALGLWAGAGMQYESHDGLRLQNHIITNRDDTPTTLRGEGRLHVQWNAWPDVLSLRARADGSLIQITRDSATLTLSNGTATTTSSHGTLRQFEILSRLFVDLDALRFFELRPAAHLGLNTISLGGRTTQSLVVGLGIRREAF